GLRRARGPGAAAGRGRGAGARRRTPGPPQGPEGPGDRGRAASFVAGQAPPRPPRFRRARSPGRVASNGPEAERPEPSGAVEPSEGGHAMSESASGHAIDALLLEQRRYAPPADFAAQANAQADIYQQDPEEFWRREAETRVSWFEPFDTVLEW